jgi:hypothetical protein
MAAIYPTTWAGRMGESPQYPAIADDGSPHPRAGHLTVYGDTWAKGLAGLGAEQLARGLESCISRSNRYLPDLGEFRALCIGVPSLVSVRADLRKPPHLRSRFATMVGRNLDWHAYRTGDGRDAERMLRQAYDDAHEAVIRGEIGRASCRERV